MYLLTYLLTLLILVCVRVRVLVVCQGSVAASSADVNSAQLVSAGAVDDDTDNVQLNGIMMNGHEDRPSFRFLLSLAATASRAANSQFFCLDIYRLVCLQCSCT